MGESLILAAPAMANDPVGSELAHARSEMGPYRSGLGPGRADADASMHREMPRIQAASRDRSIHAITRQELAELLGKVVRAGFSKAEIAKPYEALKAAEMLAKLCGWNEPERVDVQSVEVKVDAALIEQLRAGYAQLGERSAKVCLPLPVGPATEVEAGQEATPSQEQRAGHA